VEQKPTYTILTGTSKGDRKCQELLYQQFYRYGMSICLRYTATREEAVEVLNDGFMKVFMNIDQYDIKRSFTSWFRRILVNTAINYHKKNIRHNHRGLEKIPDLPVPGQNAMEELTYQEIVGVIQSLPLAYRRVFNLFVIEGYTHEEIAAMLHISIGTTKSNLSRARANLRNILTRNHEEGAERHER
jgi:RNA polymerase sigma-70 factor (ECF subfamily)